MNQDFEFAKDDRPDNTVFANYRTTSAFSTKALLFDALYDMGVWEIRTLKHKDHKRLKLLQSHISGVSHDLGWRDTSNNPLFRSTIGRMLNSDGKQLFTLSVQRLPINWREEIKKR